MQLAQTLQHQQTEAAIAPSVSLTTPASATRNAWGPCWASVELSPRTAPSLRGSLRRSWSRQQWPPAAAGGCPSPGRWAGPHPSSPSCPEYSWCSGRVAPSDWAAAPSGSEAEAWTDRWLASCPADPPPLRLTDTQRVGYTVSNTNMQTNTNVFTSSK